jgi:hypothetical protein
MRAAEDRRRRDSCLRAREALGDEIGLAGSGASSGDERRVLAVSGVERGWEVGLAVDKSNNGFLRRNRSTEVLQMRRARLASRQPDCSSWRNRYQTAKTMCQARPPSHRRSR